MKRINWQLLLGLSLIALSAVIYLIHFFIFHDVHHIFIYLVGDIAFVPIEVLLVTLIIHKLLSAREKRAMLHKLNMVIGAFYSEVGTELLDLFSSFNSQHEEISKNLIIEIEWTSKDFLEAKKTLKKYDYQIESQDNDLRGLRDFLLSRRDFLLRLLENPNLLEHETFTGLLWAVFHLTEELAARKKLKRLPESDLEHVSGDIKRAYVLLISEWLNYMQHLQSKYPYLYSLAVRTNPFNPESQAEVS